MTNTKSPSPSGGTMKHRYGPWALVTGASDGIGRALAVSLAARGLDLVLVARRADRLDALAQELAAAHGVRAHVIAADLGTDAGVRAVLEDTEALDVGLLAAAAGFGTSGAFVDGDVSAELAMLDVNCRAVVQLTHAFARRFSARGRGGIVLLSSLLAFQAVPRAAHYAATKAYVQSLAEGLHAELAPRGVDVLASAPGPVRSGFGERAAMQMSLALTPAEVAEGTLAALVRRRTTVRPGWLSWLLEASLWPLPRWARSLVLARVMAGMTAHHA
jgi:short-subunit dehydrogenase